MAQRDGLRRHREGSGKRLRRDPWQRIKHQVRRAYNLPFNDPRLTDWTELDYLRELSLLSMEADELDVTGDDEKDLTQGTFDEQVSVAATGDWEALGLDPPGAETQPGFKPVTLEDFLAER